MLSDLKSAYAFIARVGAVLVLTTFKRSGATPRDLEVGVRKSKGRAMRAMLGQRGEKVEMAGKRRGTQGASRTSKVPVAQ